MGAGHRCQNYVAGQGQEGAGLDRSSVLGSVALLVNGHQEDAVIVQRRQPRDAHGVPAPQRLVDRRENADGVGVEEPRVQLRVVELDEVAVGGGAFGGPRQNSRVEENSPPLGATHVTCQRAVTKSIRFEGLSTPFV